MLAFLCDKHDLYAHNYTFKRKSIIMKKISTILLTLVLLLSASALMAQVEVTFSVDMATFADTTDFDPAVDVVYISGEVIDPAWQEPGTFADAMMLDTDGDLVYTWTTTLTGDASYQYKYFYVPEGAGSSWDYGEWTGGDNRIVEVAADAVSLSEMWGKFMIQFMVTSDGTTPIEAAEVSDGTMMVNTDTDGMATLYGFPTETVMYTISHAEYTATSGELTMNYSDEEVAVTLTPNSIGEESSAQVFNMYPNPSTGILQVEGVEGVTQVVVFNAIGQRVLVMDNAQSSNLTLSTHNLESGIYFINFMNDRTVIATQKFLRK